MGVLIVQDYDDKEPHPVAYNVKLTEELTPTKQLSHLRVGDLRAALRHLDDGAYVGLGVTGLGAKDARFDFITVDRTDEDEPFLWFVVSVFDAPVGLSEQAYPEPKAEGEEEES